MTWFNPIRYVRGGSKDLVVIVLVRRVFAFNPVLLSLGIYTIGSQYLILLGLLLLRILVR